MKSLTVKIMGFLIIILIIAFGSVLSTYYQDRKVDHVHYELFLNHFYFSVDQSITDIDRLLNQAPQNKKLDDAIQNLNEDFLKSNLILSNAHNMMNDHLYYTDFFTQVSYFLNGIKMGGPDISAYVPPFSQDGQLDQTEITLLKTIKSHLVQVKQGIYSPATNQEDPNLTIDQVNTLLKTNLNEKASDIYKEAFNQ